jgi:hypothetical protein
MTLRSAASAFALAAATTLVLPAASVAASRHGGGGRAGGGHAVPSMARHAAGGGGHAVPRGSVPGYAPRGGVAASRHPRAGSGYGYYSYGYGHGRSGYYHPRYGYGYRPYYGYYAPYYYGYYPSFYGSIYFGWPSYSTYYSPYYYAPYGTGAYVGGSWDVSSEAGDEAPPSDAPAYREADRDAGRVRLEVRPEDASVYVDGTFAGTARELRSLPLAPGRHVIELVRPGFAVERREIEIARGQSLDVFVELQRR